MRIEDLVEKSGVGYHKLNGGYSFAVFYGRYGELRLSLKEIANELFEGTLSFITSDGLHYELLAIGKFTLKEVENLLSNSEDISKQLQTFCDRARHPFCDEIEQYVEEHKLSNNPPKLETFNLLTCMIYIGKGTQWHELSDSINARYEKFKVNLAEKVFQLIKGVQINGK